MKIIRLESGTNVAHIVVRVGRVGFGLLRWPWIYKGGFWERLWCCGVCGPLYQVRFLWFAFAWVQSFPRHDGVGR